MKHFRHAVLTFVILLIIISGKNDFVHAANTSKTQNVLILNSYHKGFSSTDDQTEGIISALKSSDKSIKISVEYLDYMRYPKKQTLDIMNNLLSFKYSNQKTDLVICTDDAAVEFALDNRSTMFPDVPIVFSGVNEHSASMFIKWYPNITGEAESINPSATIQAALKLNPSLKNVYVIYDHSQNGLACGELCIDAIKKIKGLNAIPWTDKSYNDLIDEVGNLDKNSVVILANYFVDKTNLDINFDSFTTDLSNASPAPVLYLHGFSPEIGTLGGSALTGKLQGEVAGKIGLRILNGERAYSIPIVYETPANMIFDYNQFKKYSISINDLPKGSEIINEPFSFIKTYQKLVYIVLSIIVFLITNIVVLINHISKIKKFQLKLQDNNETLTQTYEELAATEEELRTQYNELTIAQENLEVYKEELSYLAYHDSLTGLYNRNYLYEHISNSIKEIDKNNVINALMFIDADNFKFVNDTLGHSFGDKFIIEISKRLLTLKNENSALFRLGGDEFVYCLKSIKNKQQAESFADEILKIFYEPFFIEDNMINTTISVGISLYPHDGDSADILLKYADMAMYKVKGNGKNGYSFFDKSLSDEMHNRVNIEKYLKKALPNNEFIVYYQPQVNIEGNRVDGFEALIRWKSPELGMVSPLNFISLAEELGLILPIGEWILRSACSFIKELNGKRNTKYKISVNISVLQLLQDNFTEMVLNVLSEVGLEPSYLELEITESIIMESPDLNISKLKLLLSRGISIALDDFGTGYSSLSYLRAMPINTLKIDKSFVDNISNTDDTVSITDTIISLGHNLGLTIVAEGVENTEQLNYLKEHHCDKIQGYLFSKPLRASELEIFLDNS